MATLALFLALGGTGYAALRLPRNSVGSAQLRTHAVGTLKIAPGAVTSSRVKENSLTGKEINEGTLAQVPTAYQATHAGTAHTADSATTAQDAATVGGFSAAQLRLACPSGTVKYIGECFEVAERPAAVWPVAAAACTRDGDRLPSIAELATIADDTSVAFAEHEWTADLIDPGLAITAAGSNADRSEATTDQALPYRCVRLSATD
jgi:hypothetical protein